jgi:heat shock protein HslJ
MTSPRCSTFRTRLPSLLRAGGLALLAALAAGCGGESLSTDTGNPPVISGQKLHLTATATGVVVAGDAGAVPGGARVDVLNTATGQTESTTAAANGSFTVELEGSINDGYRVYAAGDGQSSSTQLTPSGAAPPQTGLAGRQFLLQSAQGYTLVTDTNLRVSFSDDGQEFGFSAGCNSYGGPYTRCGDRLCTNGLGGTEIGCDPDRHTQDEWFADFFEASPRLTLAGASLTFQSESVTLELLDREIADADRPLTGRLWSIDTFISGGAASSSPATAVPTVQFAVDGSFQFFTTCNTGEGSYTRNGQTLTLANVSNTDVACASEANRFVEASVQRVLTAGDVTFEIEASRLTLQRGTFGLGAKTD